MKHIIFTLSLFLGINSLTGQATSQRSSLESGAYPGLKLTNDNAQARFWGNGLEKWAIGSSGDATNNFFIYDYTNKASRFLIDENSGYVGIGTASPLGPLHIKSGEFSTVLTGNNIEFSRSTGPAYIWSRTPGGYISLGTNGRSRNTANANLVLRPDMNSYFNGNVGVGTTNPAMKLDVNGTVRFNNQASNYSSIQLGRDKNDAIFVDNNSNRYYGGGLFFRVKANANLNLPIDQNYINIMTLSDEGNVGIGTRDTKGFKLGVDGSVIAQEIKVANYTDWADFVFNNDYILPTLTEVENYITEKGHLKDIPSAKEVEQNGFFLGQMDAKLLQKIEELTLYTIQQEKELQQSKQIANDAKENIQTLEARLAKLEGLFAQLTAKN